MLLEETIQAFWRDSAALSAVVPPERFFLGPATFHPVPCVALVHEKSDVLFRTNRPFPWRKLLFRFEVLHESFEKGMKIAVTIEQGFDRMELRDPNDEWMYQFRLLQGENRRSDDGTWKLTRRFQLIG